MHTQESIYSGYQGAHCLNYHAIVTPDGMIVHMFGPGAGRGTDLNTLNDSGMLRMMADRPGWCTAHHVVVLTAATERHASSLCAHCCAVRYLPESPRERVHSVRRLHICKQDLCVPTRTIHWRIHRGSPSALQQVDGSIQDFRGMGVSGHRLLLVAVSPVAYGEAG